METSERRFEVEGENERHARAREANRASEEHLRRTAEFLRQGREQLDGLRRETGPADSPRCDDRAA